ncbi:hypothetical protein LOTGIDRAFT_158984 [Lottia gigantea]|uniref:Uncharacterized protein n=1 Tax=Lottia gigantea TaxID=225164 RepID=V4AM38_LOTGI|nr:hypothetical protein LOTGIDRAFT_158984 [Lottia gigantea]ESO98197.1 hypothetical protein LOTGIDRAFT_158984 [Lottia gigantea]
MTCVTIFSIFTMNVTRSPVVSPTSHNIQVVTHPCVPDDSQQELLQHTISLSNTEDGIDNQVFTVESALNEGIQTALRNTQIPSVTFDCSQERPVFTFDTVSIPESTFEDGYDEFPIFRGLPVSRRGSFSPYCSSSEKDSLFVPDSMTGVCSASQGQGLSLNLGHPKKDFGLKSQNFQPCFSP